MNFSDIVKNYESIAITGTYKNAGKTVTLNELLSTAASLNKIVGLTSIGLDGEKKDKVTETEKPVIFVTSGTIFATAEKCLVRLEAKYEILDVTACQTAIGRVIICRMKENGYVEIAGPDSNNEMIRVCDLMRSHGAQVIFIDGALNRKTQGSPAVAKGVILSTGAVLSRSISSVIEKTKHTVKLLKLPKVSEQDYQACKSAIQSQYICFIDDDNTIINTHCKTALGSSKKILSQVKDSYKAVVIPGTLVNSFIRDIQGILRHLDIKIVVSDGTKVFVDIQDYKNFEKLGGRVEVIDPINLLAVTVNPVSPEGYYFEPELFLNAMKEELYPIDVFDCMLGGA